MNKAEEILEKHTLWQGEKAVRTEEDMLLAMEEYAEWKLKNCNLQSVSNNEVAVCDDEIVEFPKCECCGSYHDPDYYCYP